MAKIHNIAKNTSYLTLALILQKIISFTYFAILARYLGPASLGQYYFAISFTTIFAIFIDLGFVNSLTREVAKDETKASRYLSNVLLLKIPLSLLALSAVFIIINLLGSDPLTKSLVYISCISMVLDSFTVTFFAVVRGFHNLKYESISSVIFQLIVLVSGVLAFHYRLNLRYIMLALSLASLFNFVYSFIVVRRYLKIKIKFEFDRQLIKEILVISWPFAVFAIFQRLYTYLDSVLLAILAGNTEVGIYQVAFKIIFALQFLPLAFTASLYPALSYYWLHNRDQLRITFERALNYLIIISLPIIFGAVALADKIVLIFKTGFAGATLPLQISIISLLFIFINFPIGSLLNACDRQRRNTFNMVIVTIVSVVLNIILIPYYKAVGASLTVLLTNILMFILGISQVRKIIAYKSRQNLIVSAKALLAAVLMGLVVYYGKNYLPLLLATSLGGVLYFVFLYVLRGFTKEDILSIGKSFRI
ncbi:MAG: flippase [Candidatus Falkowbacteria bacterium]|nr:flippase [Candidatus Falkowbacteria bacterium]